jgi:hypothetical protein
MKRIKSNYHHLQVLKTAKSQLESAIIKNCNSELVKYISECVLNVLCDNLKLTACQKRLRKFKVPLRALADKRVPISTKKRLINQQGRFLVPLLSAILPTIASLIFRSPTLKMLRKMYLVSPDYLNKNERPSNQLQSS